MDVAFQTELPNWKNLHRNKGLQQLKGIKNTKLLHMWHAHTLPIQMLKENKIRHKKQVSECESILCTSN